VTTPSITEHDGPWAEADYLRLESEINRIELINGGLLVTPLPGIAHQITLGALTNATMRAARNAGLLAVHNVWVRLAADTIVIPDLVVVDVRPAGDVVDVSEVVLLGEIISPTGDAIDRVLKPSLYVAARIGWYLTVELEPVAVRLNRLQGERYFEHAVAREGQTLTSSFPFPFAVATPDLHD
jgi:Uma2 family endonuclease